MKYLVIEDNVEINKAVCEILNKIGNCTSAFNGDDGFTLASTNSYDLIILDLNLPCLDGMDLLKALKKQSTTPLIILSARSDVESRVRGLELGADDYIVKPFDIDVFLLRVQNVLNSYYKNSGTDCYNSKGLEVDYQNRTVFVHGEKIKIAKKLFDILEYFTINKGIIIPKEQLFFRIWGVESDTIFTVTEVYVSQLRKLLEASGLSPRIVTIKNMGYIWREDE